jgi:hypothetical protein
MEPETVLCPPQQGLWPDDDSDDDPDYDIISLKDIPFDCPTDSSQSSDEDADEDANRQDTDEGADPQGADEDVDLQLDLHGLRLISPEDGSASDQAMYVCQKSIRYRN